MKRVFQYNLLLILGLMVPLTWASAQDFRLNKQVTKGFEIEKGAELRVVNKYGRIQIVPWDKDSIKFIVSVEVRAKKEAKAQSTLDGVEVDFVAYQSYIESKTSYTGEGSFWDGMKSKTSSVFSGDNKTRIDYKIYAPVYVRLDLTNKYGDIFIEDHQGAVTIDLSNGDLKVRTLSEPSHITLEFAYAKIDEMTTGKLKLDHKSELQLGKADVLELESRSSRVKISEVDQLTINSYRDKYDLGNVKTINLTGSYTYSEIEELLMASSFDTQYGSVDIIKLADEVDQLSFTANQTNISLKLPPDRKLMVDAVYNEDAGLYFPAELSNKSTTKADEENKLVKTTGSVGPVSGTPLRLKITITDGNLQVKAL